MWVRGLRNDIPATQLVSVRIKNFELNLTCKSELTQLITTG